MTKENLDTGRGSEPLACTRLSPGELQGGVLMQHGALLPDRGCARK